MFKQMLRETDSDEDVEASDTEDTPALEEYVDTKANKFAEETDPLITTFVNAYKPELDFSASYAIILSDQDRILHLQATATQVKCFYAATEEADVILRTTTKVLENIFAGRTTFQKGFMVGEISVKGNFKSIRMLDTIFDFS